MRSRAIIAAVLLMSLASGIHLGAAADSRQIKVGGQDTVTASISNPLEVPDVLRVEFDGEAVSSGLVRLSLPEETSRLNCFPEENACEVTLAPGGEKEMEFTVEGQKPGEADLEVTVSSSTTGKRAEATMNVVVVNPNPTDGFMEFLTRILGMS